jgi:hypothetical protein
MLRRFIRRQGVIGITILITLLAVLTSVVIRTVISFVTRGGMPLTSEIVIATLIPFIIAPLMSFIFVRLLKQIDDAEQRNAQLVGELQEALLKAKTLSGLLPICASCKKIRDDAGYWHQVEVYIRDHAEVDFSHGLCPDCGDDLAAQIAEMKKKGLVEQQFQL